MVGSSNANLVDLMPGSGVYWGSVYSGIFSNKSRYEWLSSENCVEVPETSDIGGRVWSLDGLGCSLTNIVAEGEKMDFQPK